MEVNRRRKKRLLLSDLKSKKGKRSCQLSGPGKWGFENNVCTVSPRWRIAQNTLPATLISPHRGDFTVPASQLLAWAYSSDTFSGKITLDWLLVMTEKLSGGKFAGRVGALPASDATTAALCTLRGRFTDCRPLCVCPVSSGWLRTLLSQQKHCQR